MIGRNPTINDYYYSQENVVMRVVDDIILFIFVYLKKGGQDDAGNVGEVFTKIVINI